MQLSVSATWQLLAAVEGLSFLDGFQHPEREPAVPVRVWFKSRMAVLYNEEWWSCSVGQ